MSVYFIELAPGGPIKIGFSANVPARIDQLENHYGRKVTLLATLPGGKAEEKAIHERFDHLRLGTTRRRRGPRVEQFVPSPELIAFIGLEHPAATDLDAIKPIPPALGTTKIKIDGINLWYIEKAARLRRMTVSEYASLAILGELPPLVLEAG